MKKGIFFVLLVCTFRLQIVFAQFSDDFSDGDFSSNPIWVGDGSAFAVVDQRLQIRAPAQGEKAFLSTPSQAIYNATWEFILQMDFNPSSNNYSKVYLTADNSNLNLPLNGYFVRVGHTADEVSLFRQDGSRETKIIEGLKGRISLTSVIVKIKVTRSSEGLWVLLSDVGNSGIYVKEGQVEDSTFEKSAYFGFQCIYTSTRADKFSFDDFVITGISVPDTQPPTLVSTTVSASNILLVFSEYLSESSAENSQNYRIENFDLPTGAQLQEDKISVLVTFDSPFTNGLTYVMQIESIEDLIGNVASTISVKILYFKSRETKPKDLIITEIYADPNPSNGLPDGEYIEIYNRSLNPIDLLGWEISDGTTSSVFPSQIVMPEEYWIAVSSPDSNLFSFYLNVVPLPNFPIINNSGESIVLKSNDNSTIDSVGFNLNWYRDRDKQEGGWSLELIDLENLCGEESNWSSSEHELGGTPEKVNSISAYKPDHTPPQVKGVFPTETNIINIYFDEKLSESLPPLENFTIDPKITIETVAFDNSNLKSISLTIKEQLAVKTQYSIQIINIRDCSGNEIMPITLKFGFPEDSDSHDIIINELLINPKSGGSRFVELFNPSSKYLNLRDWKLSNIEQDEPVNKKVLFDDDFLLKPNSYLVFASDPLTVSFQYPQTVTENLYQATIPSLNDNESSIAILNEKDEVIDWLYYTKNWHSPWVQDEEGVSLERIDFESDSNDKNNWTSASSTSGFATPGFSNSQLRVLKPSIQNDITITPEVFSPLTHGLNFTEIQYKFGSSGGTWVANVRIYDQQGHLMKTIANNETLSSQGFFRWDGDSDDGNLVQSGYYVVWFQVYNQHGTVELFRKRVVISN